MSSITTIMVEGHVWQSMHKTCFKMDHLNTRTTVMEGVATIIPEMATIVPDTISHAGRTTGCHNWCQIPEIATLQGQCLLVWTPASDTIGGLLKGVLWKSKFTGLQMRQLDYFTYEILRPHFLPQTEHQTNPFSA